LAGDLGLDGTATAVETYGDYASLAEKSLNGDDISSDDYLMAVGNTLSAAIGEIGSSEGDDPFSLQNMSMRIGAQVAVAGALYDNLDDEDLAKDYFANAVGQEVGGLAAQQATKYTTDPIVKEQTAARKAEREQRNSANNFQNDLRDKSVDALMEQYPQISQHEAEKLKQDMRDGTVESPTIKFMEDQSDADGNKVLGAFNKDTNEILIDKALYERAQAGDKAAAATLLGVMAEEQGHAVASVLEQRMGIQDFRFDEGGLAARSILQDFASSGSDVKFDLNIGGSVAGFSTSADAINNAINTQFSSARLLSDRQMGGREFSSSNNSNQYQVQAGDTFWGLAKADLGGNASEAEIQARTQQYLAANEGVDPLGLQVGQGVTIPGLIGSDTVSTRVQLEERSLNPFSIIGMELPKFGAEVLDGIERDFAGLANSISESHKGLNEFYDGVMDQAVADGDMLAYMAAGFGQSFGNFGYNVVGFGANLLGNHDAAGEQWGQFEEYSLESSEGTNAMEAEFGYSGSWFGFQLTAGIAFGADNQGNMDIALSGNFEPNTDLLVKEELIGFNIAKARNVESVTTLLDGHSIAFDGYVTAGSAELSYGRGRIDPNGANIDFSHIGGAIAQRENKFLGDKVEGPAAPFGVSGDMEWSYSVAGFMDKQGFDMGWAGKAVYGALNLTYGNSLDQLDKIGN
jgi:LysM repeat protein